MKKRGFTLIELLVVIAIIALLLSILIPSLGKVKKQAQAVICSCNLKQFGLAWHMYLDDHNQTFPEPYFGNIWVYTLRPYYANELAVNSSVKEAPRDIRFCASAKKKGDSVPYKFRAWQWGNGVIETDGSFCFNQWVATPFKDNNGKPMDYGANKGRLYWGRGAVKSRAISNIPLFGDGGWQDAYPQHWDIFPQEDGAVYNSTNTMHRYAIDRHLMHINILLMDGHQEKPHLTELWKYKWNREFDSSRAPLKFPSWVK